MKKFSSRKCLWKCCLQNVFHALIPLVPKPECFRRTLTSMAAAALAPYIARTSAWYWISRINGPLPSVRKFCLPWNRNVIIWQNFHHQLHWKLSFSQLQVPRVMKISSNNNISISVYLHHINVKNSEKRLKKQYNRNVMIRHWSSNHTILFINRTTLFKSFNVDPCHQPISPSYTTLFILFNAICEICLHEPR